MNWPIRSPSKRTLSFVSVLSFDSLFISFDFCLPILPAYTPNDVDFYVLLLSFVDALIKLFLFAAWWTMPTYECRNRWTRTGRNVKSWLVWCCDGRTLKLSWSSWPQERNLWVGPSSLLTGRRFTTPMERLSVDGRWFDIAWTRWNLLSTRLLRKVKDDVRGLQTGRRSAFRSNNLYVTTFCP